MLAHKGGLGPISSLPALSQRTEPQPQAPWHRLSLRGQAKPVEGQSLRMKSEPGILVKGAWDSGEKHFSEAAGLGQDPATR